MVAVDQVVVDVAGDHVVDQVVEDYRLQAFVDSFWGPDVDS